MNTAATDTNETDLRFCWEQVLRLRPQFRISHPYAPSALSTGVLALYALFSALEEAVCLVSDEAVARAKLGWWAQQLLGSEFGVSSHPITRQLRRSGVFGEAAEECIRGLLATTLNRLDGPAPADEVELQPMCRQVGLYPMGLELSMPVENIGHDTLLSAACTLNGLIQLLRESSFGGPQAFDWIPMKLFASYGITRQELRHGANPETELRLIERLCTLGLSWLGNREVELLAESNSSLRQRHGLRHWLIHTRLNVRQLKKMSGMRCKQMKRAFSATSVTDAWLAWRTARRISDRGMAK